MPTFHPMPKVEKDCPFVKSACMGGRCELWDQVSEKCAILALLEFLRARENARALQRLLQVR